MIRKRIRACGGPVNDSAPTKAAAASFVARNNALMSKRRRRAERPVFADIVDDARITSTPTASPSPALVAADGKRYLHTGRSVEPGRAVELVAGGAVLAWDSCGCLGGCELEWFEPADRAELVRTGPPELRHRSGRRYRGRGRLTEWRTTAGDVLVLASEDVRWGTFMY